MGKVAIAKVNETTRIYGEVCGEYFWGDKRVSLDPEFYKTLVIYDNSEYISRLGGLLRIERGMFELAQTGKLAYLEKSVMGMECIITEDTVLLKKDGKYYKSDDEGDIIVSDAAFMDMYRVFFGEFEYEDMSFSINNSIGWLFEDLLSSIKRVGIETKGYFVSSVKKSNYTAVGLLEVAGCKFTVRGDWQLAE